MSGNERTPLIDTVHVAPPTQRYSNHTTRRLCTIGLGSSLLAVFILFLLPLSIYPGHHHHYHHRPDHVHRPGSRDHPITDSQLQDILLETPTGTKAQEWSRYYSSGPHLAGTNYSQAAWTQERWQEFGIKADIVTYDCYLNYFLGHRLALYERINDRSDGAVEWKVKFEASLEEDVLEEDKITGLKERIPTYHGYSASGNVTAPFVYVNYGTYQDYQDLVDANITLKGHIAIARYGGGNFRGMKIQRAQEVGMVGIIIYTDPGDDGEFTEMNAFKPYPDGPARNPSSVQRGSVQFMEISPGDPTTPGYPSNPDVPRQPVDKLIPSIPSLPLSYAEVTPILKALNGVGLSAKDLGPAWQTKHGLEYKDVRYNIGPSPSHLTLNLVNEQDYVTTPIWNVIGVINGTLSDEVIIIGNHRDAWVAGGAVDPHSGSAAMNEVIRSLGIALSKGWKPLRTIVFASWDGEEYGLLGSTEWVEDHLPWLSDSSVAYINIDIGVNGRNMWTASHPLFHQLFDKITRLVPFSHKGSSGQTVRDTWDGEPKLLASGSDFTAFQDFAGIPSIDLGFGGNPSDYHPKSPAAYHYHSNYDTYYFMERFIDPGFHYHAALAKVISLLVAELSTASAIPFNATTYAKELGRYVSDIKARINASIMDVLLDSDIEGARSRPSLTVPKGHPSSLRHALEVLSQAVAKFHAAAFAHDAYAVSTSSRIDSRIPERVHVSFWRWIRGENSNQQMQKINQKYKMLDRNFLHPEGLDGRPWYKHVIYAPGLWTGYTGPAFPGLVEAVDSKDWDLACKWAKTITDRIRAATRSLK